MQLTTKLSMEAKWRHVNFLMAVQVSFPKSVKQAAEFDWPAWWQWSGQAENNDITTTMLLSTCPLSTPRCVQIADCCPRTGRGYTCGPASMLCTQAYSIIF